MALKLITPPAMEPVSRNDVKLRSRITDSSQDDSIDRYIVSARRYVENRLERQLIQATWKQSFDRFPSPCDRTRDKDLRRPSFSDPSRVLVLDRPPLISVTSIQYYDSAGVLQTWDASNYVVDNFSEPGRIQLADGSMWPVTAYRLNAVQVTYVAGYGADSSNVPDDIKHAIEMLASHYYENREAVGDVRMYEVPLTVDALLDLHRIDFF